MSALVGLGLHYHDRVLRCSNVEMMQYLYSAHSGVAAAEARLLSHFAKSRSVVVVQKIIQLLSTFSL